MVKAYTYIKRQGRNNQGKITVRHRGGGFKRRSFKLNYNFHKEDLVANVKRIFYYPLRNCYICLLRYETGETFYILKPFGLRLNDNIVFTLKNIDLTVGNVTILKNIPFKTKIHNISRNNVTKSKFVRSPGSFAEIIYKTKNFVTVILPSGKYVNFSIFAKATIGFIEVKKIKLKKAGNNRHLGKRPIVKGNSMNACDHPHGGGEGKTPIGRKYPMTPWGKI